MAYTVEPLEIQAFDVRELLRCFVDAAPWLRRQFPLPLDQQFPTATVTQPGVDEALPGGRQVLEHEDPYRAHRPARRAGPAGRRRHPDRLPCAGRQAALAVPVAQTLPTDMSQCKNDGWKQWQNVAPFFKNQGDCVSFTNNSGGAATPPVDPACDA